MVYNHYSFCKINGNWHIVLNSQIEVESDRQIKAEPVIINPGSLDLGGFYYALPTETIDESKAKIRQAILNSVNTHIQQLEELKNHASNPENWKTLK